MNMLRVFTFSVLVALTSLAFAQSVNINTADAETLESLTGVGPVKAQAIIDHREEQGRFSTVDEVENVDGIGPATLEAIRDQLTVDDN